MSERQAPDNFILRLMRGEAPPHPIGETLGARILELDLAAMLDDITASLGTATATCMLVAARPKPPA